MWEHFFIYTQGINMMVNNHILFNYFISYWFAHYENIHTRCLCVLESQIRLLATHLPIPYVEDCLFFFWINHWWSGKVISRFSVNQKWKLIYFLDEYQPSPVQHTKPTHKSARFVCQHHNSKVSILNDHSMTCFDYTGKIHLEYETTSLW